MTIPGVSATIKDRFYGRNQANIPGGPRVLIIGKRNTDDGTYDAPSTNASRVEVQDLDPYYALDEDRVINAFGEGSDCHRGFLEALAGGANHVYIVALPSDTTFDYDLGTISSDNFDIATGGTENLFDAAFSAAEIVRPDVIVPWGRGGHSTEWEDIATPDNEPTFGFYADNGTVAPVYDGDGELVSASPSFAWQVAKKCHELTQDSHPVFAIMGVKPYVGNKENMIPSQVASHLELTNLIDREDMGDYGRYLIVIAGELRPTTYRDYPEYGYSNGAAMLAGDISRRDEWDSPTNKIVYNLTALRYTPSKSTQLSLIDKAVVPVIVGYNRFAQWVDVMTFSPDGSDYARLTTLRIVFAAIQVVRTSAQPYVGQAATIAVRNALETQVTSGLRAMQQQGALYASTPSFTYIASTNEVIVDLILVPAFEIRNVEVRVSVNLTSAI